MRYNVDVVRIRENSITLNGWAIGKTPEEEVTFSIEDASKKPITFQYVPTRRDDVSQIYFKKIVDKDFGFDIRFEYERGCDYYLVIQCGSRRARIKYNEDLIAKRTSVATKDGRKSRI